MKCKCLEKIVNLKYIPSEDLDKLVKEPIKHNKYFNFRRYTFGNMDCLFAFKAKNDKAEGYLVRQLIPDGNYFNLNKMNRLLKNVEDSFNEGIYNGKYN